MNNFSDIDIISQKTDVIQQTSDFYKTSLSNTNRSVDWLREYQPAPKAQAFWWIDDIENVYFSKIKEILLGLEVLSGATSSVSRVIPLSNEDFKAKHRTSFFRLIKSTRFISGEDNQATEMLSMLLGENKDATLSLLEEYFVGAMSKEKMDESLLVKILTMLNDYDYKDLSPTSQIIALCALKVKSIKVSAASFNLFGHWGNCEALNLLRKYDEPEEPWLKMKYNALLHSLKERCSTHVK